MSSRRAIMVGCLLAGIILLGACAPANVPVIGGNPSERLVNGEVISIDGAVGSAMGMGGGSAGLRALVTGEQPNWPRAVRSVATIERAWPRIRRELDRRAERQAGANQAVVAFEYNLAPLKAALENKNSEQADMYASRLANAFAAVKGVLATPDVDAYRFLGTVEVFLAGWVVLTLVAHYVGRRRDRNLMRIPGGLGKQEAPGTRTAPVALFDDVKAPAQARSATPAPSLAVPISASSAAPAAVLTMPASVTLAVPVSAAPAAPAAAAAMPAPQASVAYSFDLLAVRPFRAFARSSWVPLVFQTFMVMVFVYAIYAAFVGLNDRGNNFGILLFWSVFWPSAIMISAVTVGKVWCAICPLGAISAAVQRFGLNRMVPPKLRTGIVALMLWVFIVWTAREVLHISSVGILTGWFWLAFLALAIGVGFLFRDRAWCKSFCPIGIPLGLWSMLSFLELRPKRDKCAACTTHECLRGDGVTRGCPMELNPGRLESNRDCTLCMNCVKTCTHSSPQLRLRLPGKELTRVARPLLIDAGYALWVPVVLMIKENMEHYYTPDFLRSATTAVQNLTGGANRQGIWFIVVTLFGGALLVGTFAGAAYLASRLLGWKYRTTFAAFSYMFVPIVLVTIGGHSLHYFFANIWGPMLSVIAATIGIYVYLEPAAFSQAGLMLIGAEFGTPVLYALGFLVPIALPYPIAANRTRDHKKALKAALPFSLIAAALAFYFLWTHVSLTGGPWRW